MNLADQPARTITKEMQTHSKRETPKRIRKYTTVRCSHCKKLFEKRADQVNRRNEYNYCSKSCVSESNGEKLRGRAIPSMRKGKEIPCKVCGKNFYVSGSRLKNNAKFCSRECFGKWMIDHPRKNFITSADNKGEKNGRYKHGKRVGGHVSKKKVRESVISRDGQHCLICGLPGPGLHLHRVVYGSQGGKYEVDNCVLLCAVHHEEVHSSKRKWLPILEVHLKVKTDRGSQVV